MQVGEAESTIRQKKSQLGEMVLELVRAGKLSEPSFGGIVQEIGQQEARLAELRDELAETQPTSGSSPA
jgi:hypothetical protein